MTNSKQSPDSPPTSPSPLRLARLRAASAFASWLKVFVSHWILLAPSDQGWVPALRHRAVRAKELWAPLAGAGGFLLLLAGGGWFYHSQREDLLGEAEEWLKTIAQLKVRLVHPRGAAGLLSEADRRNDGHHCAQAS